MKVNLDELETSSDIVEQDKLADAISRLEGFESSLDYISGMDVMDETPNEVSYQLEELGSDLSTLREIIEDLESLKCNIIMTEEQFLNNNKEVEKEVLENITGLINGETNG